MKIRTQVSISLIIFVILTGLIIFSIYSSNNQLQEIDRKQQIISEIEKGSFELYYLENDYFLHGGERPVKQWNSTYVVLSGQLKELIITDPHQQGVFNALSDGHKKLQATFSDLVAVTGYAQGKEPISDSQELKEFAWSTLTGQTQTMLSRSSELSQLVKAEALQIQQRNTLVISGSIAVLMVFVFLNYLFITRSLLRSISKLHEGTELIGSGDLDIKIETGNNDELGDLSRAFNTMTSNLKTARTLLLTSNTELEQENAKRMRAEEETQRLLISVQEEKEKLSTLINSIADEVWFTDTQHRFSLANPQARSEFGLDHVDETDVETLASSLEVLRPDGTPRPIEEAPPLRALSGEVIKSMEEIVRTPATGELRYRQVSAAPVRDASGNIIGSVSVVRDITERKRAEEALAQSEERYRTLAEATPDQIFIIGRDDTLKHANPAALKLFRLPYDQVVGKPRKDLFPPQIVKSQEASLQKIFETGGSTRKDEMIQFGTKEFWIDTRLVPLKDEAGIVTSVLGIARDITERKRAEEAMRIFSEELEHKVIERTSDLSDINMKLMTEIDIRLNAEQQLTKTVGEKEVLLREVHHRVKNNLQIIISLLNLQSQFITDETTLSAFRESQNRIRAMALVHEKLYQSKDISKINLDDYIRFLGNSLFQFYGMKGKGIILTTDIQDILLDINTAIPVGLITNELVSNSLKHAFPDGRKGEISLAIQRENHTLTILFKDNGVGIPEDFDWRNPKSLGLRLVVSLVAQLFGTIELDRTAGTAFTIVLKEKE